ncbi:hypothetical protein BHE74_00046012 [Ensete ventricosum]|nr:hypothetical protein BHE74_00046012 [Ensete ventricosum]
MESQTTKHMIEDDCAKNGIPLPNGNAKILARVLQEARRFRPLQVLRRRFQGLRRGAQDLGGRVRQGRSGHPIRRHSGIDLLLFPVFARCINDPVCLWNFSATFF